MTGRRRNSPYLVKQVRPFKWVVVRNDNPWFQLFKSPVYAFARIVAERHTDNYWKQQGDKMLGWRDFVLQDGVESWPQGPPPTC